MKYIKWKTLIITSVICLSPILLGIALWNKLPELMPIHFDIHNNADNFSSKKFAVFALPCILLFAHLISCILSDINTQKRGKTQKLETITKWIVPVLSLVLQTMTYCYALGKNVDIRRIVLLIVGVIFIVTGNYLPKYDYVKNIKLDSEKARKINRFVGHLTVILGLTFLVSIPFSPIISVICLCIIIPYTVICIVYAIKIIKTN